jgi:hypothetical protein
VRGKAAMVGVVVAVGIVGKLFGLCLILPS